jgi:hypothetical protein
VFWFCSVLCTISINSWLGILVYMFVMSKENNLMSSLCKYLSSVISCRELPILSELDKVVPFLIGLNVGWLTDRPGRFSSLLSVWWISPFCVL